MFSESLPQLPAILHKQVLQVCGRARSRAGQTCTKVSIMMEMVMTKSVRGLRRSFLYDRAGDHKEQDRLAQSVQFFLS